MLFLHLLGWILLSILCLLLFILIVFCLLSFSVHILWEENDRAVTVSVGPFQVLRFPKKPSPRVKLSDFTYQKHARRLQKEALRAEKKLRKRKKQVVKPAKQPTGKQDEKAEKHGFSLSLTDILALVRLLPRFVRGIHITLYHLEVNAGGADTAATAKQFGILSQGIAYLFELLDQKLHFTPPAPSRLAVRADFLAPKTTVWGEATVRLTGFHLLCTAFSLLRVFLQILMQQKKPN